MKIQSNHTEFIPFKSRNKIIRYADDIVRRVNVCYPRISSTRIECYNNISKFPNIEPKLIQKIENSVRSLKSKLFDEENTFFDNIKAFIFPVKRYKVGNCGESAQLASIIAKINGLKDCQIVQLMNDKGEDLDHVVLLVNDKKSYIIDSWLGFADYVHNALNKYKNEYRHILNIEDSESVILSSDIDNVYNDFLKNDFSRKQINKLKRIYPEMIIKRGYV